MFFTWEAGRQKAPYDKMRLFQSKRFKFDVYLLRVRPEAMIPFHKDPAPDGFVHKRFNMSLWGYGLLTFEKEPNKFFWPLGWSVIRASEQSHGFYSSQGICLLSIGWLTAEEKA